MEHNINNYIDWNNKVSGYCDTYMYGMEYVDPTQELYDRLCKYIDSSNIDYEAFKNGDQVVVFLQKKVSNYYDKTLTPGTMLNLHYYLMPVNAKLSGLNVLSGNNEEDLSVFPYWKSFIDIADGKLYESIKQEYRDAIYTYYNDKAITYTDEYYALYHKMMHEPCVSSEVAAVIQVDDDVKKDLSDILTEYGYYTAIASTELGRKAVQNQNTLMKDYLGEDYDESMNCKFKYNQITTTYDLSSSYCATDNILSSYFKANDVIYMSSANDKETMRTNLLNALLQYGITMIATIVIHILIYSILTRNRLELRRKRLELLLRLGAEKKSIRAICMIEVVRESLWCIFTAPLLILVQYIICEHKINNSTFPPA